MVVTTGIHRTLTDRTARPPGRHERIDGKAEGLQLLATDVTAEGGRRARLDLGIVGHQQEELILLVVAKRKLANAKLQDWAQVERERTLARRPVDVRGRGLGYLHHQLVDGGGHGQQLLTLDPEVHQLVLVASQNAEPSI